MGLDLIIVIRFKMYSFALINYNLYIKLNRVSKTYHKNLEFNFISPHALIPAAQDSSYTRILYECSHVRNILIKINLKSLMNSYAQCKIEISNDFSLKNL